MIIVGDRVVNPNLCDHKSTPPVCNCFHDWRIHWGNVPKQGGIQPTLQTDGWVEVPIDEEDEDGTP
ncbi:hypothetical protein SEA_NEDARYA_20 [Gordonia phage Nedarya]|nr:hypothetical protein SEA_NEDARYA_20 [Gordonia phage Nedarya]